MHPLSRRSILAVAAAALATPHVSWAQGATRIVFPFGAGGAADALLRIIAEQLRPALQTAVIVENKTGGAGQIGVVSVKDAPPDGSTLLFATGAQMTLQPHFYAKIGYDPFKDFAPLSQAFAFTQAVVVGADLPVKSFSELMAWLRQNPDRAVYGSPGAGTAAHFVGVEIARAEKFELRHTPYRGTPAAMPDLMTGRLTFYIASAAEMVEADKAGKIRVLATAGTERYPSLPNVPTLREGGLDLVAPGWFAFYVPARTPGATVTRLERAIVDALRAPDLRAKIEAAGFFVTGTSASELAAIQRAEFAYWGPIVKASGYKAES